jgi:hypothetical protein
MVLVFYGICSPGIPGRSLRDPSVWIPKMFEDTHELAQSQTQNQNQTNGVESTSTSAAAPSSAIAIPNSSPKPSAEGDGSNTDADGSRGEGMGSAPGNAGSASVSLLTKSLQMFSDSPPSASVEFFQGHFNQPFSVVGPHVTLSQSLRERGLGFGQNPNPNLERRGSQPLIQRQSQLQDDEEYQHQQQQQKQDSGFLPSLPTPEEYAPSSLPSYHQRLQEQAQQQFDNALAEEEQWQAGMRGPLPDGFPRRVRKTSFDHTVDRVDDVVRLRGRHQVDGRPMPPPENPMVCLIVVLKGVYF